MQADDAGPLRAITRQRDTRFLHIAKHGGKTGKGLRSSHGFFPSEVSNNMRSARPRSLLRDLGRMSRGSALDERNAAPVEARLGYVYDCSSTEDSCHAHDVGQ